MNDEQAKQSPGSVTAWLRANIHFIIAVVLMLGTGVAITAAGWVEKKPVPWPLADMEVSEDSRLLTFPTKIGPYQRVEEDGVLFRERDGRPDGEIVIESDVLTDLGMGSTLDRQRHLRRRSNWYLSRFYLNTRADAGLYALWRLEIYYYTGLRDNVPHVPEICLTAGGVQVDRARSGPLTLKVSGLTDSWETWREASYYRTVYRKTDSNTLTSSQGVEYYVFSMNARPTDNRHAVRLELNNPLVSHCYFAKIQFSPVVPSGIDDLRKADEKAMEFLEVMLPEVLKVLPTAEQVEAAGASERDK